MSLALQTDPLSDRVVVLYADPHGPYSGLVVDVYDETRDARTYSGMRAVVAHPPCGPWGALKHLSQKQNKDLGPHAVSVVRRNGGVLEHPHGSGLFAHCGLPRPGALPDAWGGVTFELNQVDWGHVARKKTWIYVVGAAPGAIPSAPPSREPTHWVSGGRNPNRKGSGGLVPDGIKVCSAQQRRRTPVDFARFLIGIAERCIAPRTAESNTIAHGKGNG